MITPKIIPSIWISTENGQLAETLAYYKAVFGADFTSGTPIPLGDTPSGNTEMCQIKLFGLPYSLMATAQEHHPLNDAFSLTLRCSDQNEIDHFWDYFTADGSESACGWCIDKYGLDGSIPHNLESF